MTLARRLLLIVDETETYVPRSVRRAVEAQEPGQSCREGDPVRLLEELTRTRQALHNRLRVVASRSPMV